MKGQKIKVLLGYRWAFRFRQWARIIGLLSSVWLVVTASAEILRIDSQQAWTQWDFPAGLVQPQADGSVHLQRFRRSINAVANAAAFSYKDARGLQVWGGLRNVGSNAAQADNILDGDATTWWAPSANDALSEWAVELDLGRVVQATKIRLLFPDQEGARPLREFSVFANDGARAISNQDIFQFDLVGLTTLPNRSQSVEYVLSTPEQGQATGQYLTIPENGILPYKPVQYIRVEALSKNPGAALAEIEVEALGDNIALGTFERGGSIRTERNPATIAGIVDGTMNGWWAINIARVGDWRELGIWYEWDLGATFWLDQLIALEPYRFTRSNPYRGFQAGQVFFEFLVSGGEQASLGTDGTIQSAFDYQQLSFVDNSGAGSSLARTQIFDFSFEPRKVRYLFYHSESPRNMNFTLLENFVYGEGYPAETEMQSDFIDLDGNKTLNHINWVGDTPLGTRIEIRSRTGDTFQEKVFYYNKNGLEIPAALWEKLPLTQKLPIKREVKAGTDWSSWSAVYTPENDVFLSPSPRNFVQLAVRLISDKPSVAPVLRAIEIDFDDALVDGGIFARILPARAPLDSLVMFSLQLLGGSQAAGADFDRLFVVLPEPLAGTAEVHAEGHSIVPQHIEIRADTLIVDLPQSVSWDSLALTLPLRLRTAATGFSAWVGLSTRPDVRQGIRPAYDEALMVLVPEVFSDPTLIRQLTLSGATLTPNGDGINDQVEIRLLVVRTNRPPQLSIYDLSGQRLASPLRVDRDHYVWDGRNEHGDLVAPGIYLVDVWAGGEARTEHKLRPVHIVY